MGHNRSGDNRRRRLRRRRREEERLIERTEPTKPSPAKTKVPPPKRREKPVKA
jgi:hypothetical protein